MDLYNKIKVGVIEVGSFNVYLNKIIVGQNPTNYQCLSFRFDIEQQLFTRADLCGYLIRTF